MDKVETKELIGRDRLLKREIYPRLRSGKFFVLVGQREIGKTELLKWAFVNCKDESKVFLSCNQTRGEIVKSIAKAMGITVGKKKVRELEEEVLKSHTKVTLFVDDLERISPKQAVFLTVLGNWNSVYLAGIGSFKERVKRLLWGRAKIRVKAIDRRNRLELGRHVVRSLGCLMSPAEISQESKGVPGRAWALGKGEFFRGDDERVEGEEVNIAPVMLVGVVAIMTTRYVALGLGERDLYMLAGIGMGVSYLFRYAIRIVSKD
ncbi:hypothetical protein [Halonatronum saccharophilum]|uniref:hypothetical protein n=1 Tax=Halonatronum saccharophilum TaxID=150060 RepID=UPI0004808370|nr:hypothetical protein [Halonatronum saccharophilum]